MGNSGHSIRETPGLIPNPEVKPDNVSYCTEVRESSGTMVRCYYPSSLHQTNCSSYLLTSARAFIRLFMDNLGFDARTGNYASGTIPRKHLFHPPISSEPLTSHHIFLAIVESSVVDRQRPDRTRKNRCYTSCFKQGLDLSIFAVRALGTARSLYIPRPNDGIYVHIDRVRFLRTGLFFSGILAGA